MSTRVTVLEVIQRSAAYLAEKGVESPRLQIELLLAHALKVSRLNLYLDFQRELARHELEVLRQMIKRRATREPLQHIVGSTSFCGLELSVTREVLIPRPETELLAERAWTLLNEQGSATDASPSVLDFGTGSGCLAVSLAVKSPRAEVYALDVSEAALEVARRNAAHHRVADRIHFVHGAGLTALPHGLRVDVLVSNPPYVPSGEIETLAPEVRDHDPRLALDGGADGLDFYRRFAREAGSSLRTGGRMLLEFGDGQETRIQEILESAHWLVEAIERDYSGRPRLLIARPLG